MTQRVSTRTLVLVGLAICLLLAAVVSFWASGHPDGLEHVAETLGFADSAGEHGSDGSPFADYGTKGVDGPLSGGLAGVVGVALTAAVMWLVLRLVRRRD